MRHGPADLRQLHYPVQLVLGSLQLRLRVGRPGVGLPFRLARRLRLGPRRLLRLVRLLAAPLRRLVGRLHFVQPPDGLSTPVVDRRGVLREYLRVLR